MGGYQGGGRSRVTLFPGASGRRDSAPPPSDIIYPLVKRVHTLPPLPCEGLVRAEPSPPSTISTFRCAPWPPPSYAPLLELIRRLVCHPAQQVASQHGVFTLRGARVREVDGRVMSRERRGRSPSRSPQRPTTGVLQPVHKCAIVLAVAPPPRGPPKCLTPGHPGSPIHPRVPGPAPEGSRP
jgi:hypothetical protein